MKKNEPTIKCTEFLDSNGDMFASSPGIGNIQTNGERGEITKRTKWSDGAVTNESGFIYQTKGIPTRKDLKVKNEIDILRV